MENKNKFLVKMDLSNMPTDIMPVIGKHLLSYDNKFKFNKIFRKKQDNKLLKFFFGEDTKLFKFINNYIGNDYIIECKDIDLNPLMKCINNTYNLNVKKIRLLYNPKSVGWITPESFKYYEEEIDENYYNKMDKKKIIFNKIKKMKIENKIINSHLDSYAYEMERQTYINSDTY